MTTTKPSKPLTVRDVVRYLSLWDEDLTNKDIRDRLDWLGHPECSTFLIGQIRGSFRSDMRFLEKLGLLRDRPPIIPNAIRRLKPPKPKHEPVPRYHYGRQSRDD